MATLGSLVIQLEANMAKFSDALSKAEMDAARRADLIQKHLSGIGKALTGLAAAAGVGLSLKEIWGQFEKLAAAESSLLKMANRLNTTTEDLSSLGLVARKTGMDADAFNAALERMQKNVSNATLNLEASAGAVDEFGEPLEKSSRTLDELGLKADMLNRLPLPDKLKAIAVAMKENVAPADQSRIALELFGRAGGGMVLALKDGPEALDKLIERMEKLGGVISTEGAKKMAEAKTATGDLTIAWNNFSRELYEGVAPAIATTIGLLADLIAQANRTSQARADITAGVHTGDFGAWAEGGVGIDKPRGATGSWVSEEVMKSPKRPAPKNAGGGKGGGGGGGLEGAQRQLENFIDSMQSATAQIYGETFAVIDSWYNKQARALDALEAKVGESLVARNALEAAYQAKRDKLGKELAEKEEKEIREKAEAQEKHWMASLELQKGVFEELSRSSPVLGQQLVFKQRALDLELQINRATFEKKLLELENARVIDKAQADELRGLQALAEQSRRFAEMREQWSKEGFGGGLKRWAFERTENKQTRDADAAMDFMKGAESWIGNTMADSFLDRMHGRKTDLSKMFSDLGDAAVRRLFQWGTQKAFDFGASLLGFGGGALGGKPTGTAAHPFFVRLVGGAGLLGGGQTREGFLGGGGAGLGGGAMSGGIFGNALKWFRQMREEKEDFLDEDDLKDYGSGFGTMARRMAGFWGAGQEAMTGATEMGSASRIASLMGEGSEGLSILGVLAKGHILMQAGQAGAAGFKSVMEALPWPWNMVVAPIVATAAFAATMAFGSGFGDAVGSGFGSWGGSSGGGGLEMGGMSSTSSFSSSFHRGGIIGVAHQGLALDEGLFLGLSGEGVLSRPVMDRLGPRRFEALRSGNFEVGAADSGGNLQIDAIHFNIDARGADRNIDWDQEVRARIMPAVVRDLERRGYKLGAKR